MWQYARIVLGSSYCLVDCCCMTAIVSLLFLKKLSWFFCQETKRFWKISWFYLFRVTALNRLEQGFDLLVVLLKQHLHRELRLQQVVWGNQDQFLLQEQNLRQVVLEHLDEASQNQKLQPVNRQKLLTKKVNQVGCKGQIRYHQEIIIFHWVFKNQAQA